MPLDLFGGDGRRPATPSSHPRSILIVSIGLHAIVIGGALFLSISASGLMPTPRLLVAFVEPEQPKLDIELPRPAPSRSPSPNTPAIATAPAADSAPADAAALAPVVAPTGVREETGLENAAVSHPSNLTALESGPGAGFGVATVERPPAPPVQAPVRLHSGIQAPLRLTNVEPLYPPLAQSAHVQGVVILEAIIDVTGRVESLRVLKSIPLLDDAARAAVQQWRFSPARLNGEVVPVIMTVTVVFKL